VLDDRGSRQGDPFREGGGDSIPPGGAGSMPRRLSDSPGQDRAWLKSSRLPQANIPSRTRTTLLDKSEDFRGPARQIDYDAVGSKVWCRTSIKDSDRRRPTVRQVRDAKQCAERIVRLRVPHTGRSSTGRYSGGAGVDPASPCGRPGFTAVTPRQRDDGTACRAVPGHWRIGRRKCWNTQCATCCPCARAAASAVRK